MNRGTGQLTRLLILWLLSEQPQHGYSIRRSLSDSGLSFWFPIEDASIYSSLRTLTSQGWAKELGVEQEGNRPQRTRYAITPEGRTEYERLLKLALTTLEPPAGMISMALAATADLSEQDLRDGIQQRIQELKTRLEQLQQLARASPSRWMVERETVLVTAELEWCQKLHDTEFGGKS